MRSYLRFYYFHIFYQGYDLRFFKLDNSIEKRLDAYSQVTEWLRSCHISQTVPFIRPLINTP